MKEIEFLEYAISEGEGTLIEYGVTDFDCDVPVFDDTRTMTIIMTPCDADCETGK